MNYYYIVEERNPKLKYGIYGRREINKFELQALKTKVWHHFVPIYSYYSALNLVYSFGMKIISGSTKIKINKINFKNKSIIIPNYLLQNYYGIDTQKELFHGLFDDKILKEKDFKIMMDSNNQVNLIIISRKDLPIDLIHFGGKLGVFDLGLYCSHPKNNKLLLPVNNYRQIVEELVLNEIIKAYQFLGAKQIVIEDVTKISGKSDNQYFVKKGKVEVDFENKILIEKNYGSGVFNPTLALESTYFIRDFPSVMNTIDSRIHGNIISDKIEREINLSLGLDLGIIKIFKSNSNFDYERKWKFDVVFFDKNEIQL